jgi:hypothetical protein
MPKLNPTYWTALVLLLQTALPVEAVKNDVSKTHQLLDSKGRAVASEVTSQPATRTPARVTTRRRFQSNSRRSTMIQAIHQAARKQ